LAQGLNQCCQNLVTIKETENRKQYGHIITKVRVL